MCLWCCWKDLNEQDLIEFICKNWNQIVGNIDLKVFYATENSNKLQKPSFGRKNLSTTKL